MGNGNGRVFPVKLKIDERLVKRICSLPEDARVLMVFADEDFAKMGMPIVERYKELLGSKCHYEPKRFSDFLRLQDTRRQALIIVSAHVWDELPEKLRELPNVVVAHYEVDMHSLEEIRIAAGILIQLVIVATRPDSIRSSDYDFL